MGGHDGGALRFVVVTRVSRLGRLYGCSCGLQDGEIAQTSLSRRPLVSDMNLSVRVELY